MEENLMTNYKINNKTIDQKVLDVQLWLLNEYNNNNYPEFQNYVIDVNFEATGITGWKTMTALVYALQYELNINSPNGSFGPLTVSLSPNLNQANHASYPVNIISILKGGFWCSGYNPGYASLNVFEPQTTIAINEFRSDIGLTETGTISGYIWKSLLSTDAFVTTWTGGSEALREVQQELNGLSLNGFPFVEYMEGYIPTDGLGSRQLSNAFIIYIQAVAGDTPSEVAPLLGPYTQNILKQNPLPETNNSYFIKLAGYMLRANGYDNAPIYNAWSYPLSREVSFFQHDMALPPTGEVDFSTWMAGLISYGDINRPYSVCDTRFEITESRLLKLRSMGIEAVGRYLTGGDFKGLREDEVPRILGGDMGLIPIFQGDGTNNSSFNYNQGQQDAQEARSAAIRLGIPNYSIIYFAVDYDPQGHEIHEYVHPYFEGIRDKLLEGGSHTYRIGIYGTRNVCTTIQSLIPEVTTSYVSNMSSGFSGNLGFKMPNNWNFDQFDEIMIDDWGIDKVIYSGKFPYVRATPTLDNNNEELFAKNPEMGDDFSIQPEVQINFGEKVDVFGYIEKIEGNDYLRNKIGSIHYGQYFTRMGRRKAWNFTRVIFTDKNGLAAYGYVDNREFDYSEPPSELNNTEPFYRFNYDPISNSLVEPEGLYTSPNPIEFTVMFPLKYYGESGYLGILPVGTKLYIKKSLGVDGLYYGHSQAGVNFPAQMAFDKMKLPGGTVTAFDLNNPNSVGWVDLGYSHGSLGANRAIY